MGRAPNIVTTFWDAIVGWTNCRPHFSSMCICRPYPAGQRNADGSLHAMRLRFRIRGSRSRGLLRIQIPAGTYSQRWYYHTLSESSWRGFIPMMLDAESITLYSSRISPPWLIQILALWEILIRLVS